MDDGKKYWEIIDMSGCLKVGELEKNIPGNADWEGSFVERLSEYCIWDEDAFWKLHLDLISRANKNSIDRQLAYMVVFLQQIVLNLVAAHFDGNDIFIIENIEYERLAQFRERLDLAIIGVHKGEVLPESSFYLKNPFLKA